MAYGYKTGGRDFKKGDKVNLGKKRTWNASARKFNRELFEVAAAKYLYAPLSVLKEISSKPDTPSVDLILISLIMKSIKKGEPQCLNFLLDRTIGKVKEEKEVEVHADITIPQLYKIVDKILSDDEKKSDFE